LEATLGIEPGYPVLQPWALLGDVPKARAAGAVGHGVALAAAGIAEAATALVGQLGRPRHIPERMAQARKTAKHTLEVVLILVPLVAVLYFGAYPDKFPVNGEPRHPGEMNRVICAEHPAGDEAL
jgi:hypothetical protein